MNNLESIVTYEGAADVHTLVIGGALTGSARFAKTGTAHSGRR
jgi:glutaryl-CoA dehydrogenase